MKTKTSGKHPHAKLSYEVPSLRSMDIELEEGIANNSPGGVANGSETPKGRWSDTQTQTSEGIGDW